MNEIESEPFLEFGYNTEFFLEGALSTLLRLKVDDLTRDTERNMSCDILAVLKSDPAWGGGLILPLKVKRKEKKVTIKMKKIAKSTKMEIKETEDEEKKNEKRGKERRGR